MATQTCARSVIYSNMLTPVVMSMFGGKTLDFAHTLTVPGDVYAWLAAKNPGIKGRRMIRAFVDMIDNGDIHVQSVPSDLCGPVSSSNA